MRACVQEPRTIAFFQPDDNYYAGAYPNGSMGVNRSLYSEKTLNRRTQCPFGGLNGNAGVAKTPLFENRRSNQVLGMMMARMM